MPWREPKFHGRCSLDFSRPSVAIWLLMLQKLRKATGRCLVDSAAMQNGDAPPGPTEPRADRTPADRTPGLPPRSFRPAPASTPQGAPCPHARAPAPASLREPRACLHGSFRPAPASTPQGTPCPRACLLARTPGLPPRSFRPASASTPQGTPCPRARAPAPASLREPRACLHARSVRRLPPRPKEPRACLFVSKRYRNAKWGTRPSGPEPRARTRPASTLVPSGVCIHAPRNPASVSLCLASGKFTGSGYLLGLEIASGTDQTTFHYHPLHAPNERAIETTQQRNCFRSSM